MIDTDYVYWDKLLNEQELIDTNNFIENNYDSIETDKTQASNPTGQNKKQANTKLITLGKLAPYVNHCLDQAYLASARAYGYNVYPRNGLDTFLHAVYSDKDSGKYDFHYDGSRSDVYDVKLSFIINLSLKPYEGGKFKIFNNDEYEIEKFTKPGSAILFKSYLNHRVTPVTKGERRSLTTFLCGPKFR